MIYIMYNNLGFKGSVADRMTTVFYRWRVVLPVPGRYSLRGWAFIRKWPPNQAFFVSGTNIKDIFPAPKDFIDPIFRGREKVLHLHLLDNRA
jgi:hypothetical protein